jgi:hypothetical protein
MPASWSNVDKDKFVFNDRSKGAWHGFLLGSGLGVVVGAFLGWAESGWCEDPTCHDDYPVGDILAGVGIMAGIFGGLGIGMGWAVGSKEFYLISHPKADEKE